MSVKMDSQKIKELYDKGLKTKEIASIMDCNYHTVNVHIRSLGIIRRSREYKTKVDKNQAKTLYEQGFSTTQIAEKMGLNKSIVSTQIQKMGISRNKSEAIKLAFTTGRMTNKGERHPNWKGGIRHPKDGYVYIYAPEHSRAKASKPYVQEHILVWEKAHNKPLPEGWLIHHINGIRDDNRPRNLLALAKGKHSGKMIMLEVKQRIRELETEVKLLERAFDEHQAIFRISEN